MTAIQIPSRVPHFQLEQLDDERLLYHPDLAKTIRLNPTASLVWELCDGRRSVGDIIALLADAYADDGTHVADDVTHTLGRLVAEGALTLA